MAREVARRAWWIGVCLNLCIVAFGRASHSLYVRSTECPQVMCKNRHHHHHLCLRRRRRRRRCVLYFRMIVLLFARYLFLFIRFTFSHKDEFARSFFIFVGLPSSVFYIEIVVPCPQLMLMLDALWGISYALHTNTHRHTHTTMEWGKRVPVTNTKRTRK